MILFALLLSVLTLGCTKPVRTQYTPDFVPEPWKDTSIPACHSVPLGTTCVRCDDTEADKKARPIPAKCLRMMLVTYPKETN